jgi:endonuclease-3
MDKKDFSRVLVILNKIYKVKMERERPFDILIHGILSTRTKDETTFPAQSRLLRIADNPKKLFDLDVKTIKKAIFPVSFYKTKARLLKKTALMLLEDFNSEVPRSKVDLLKLPGVGPKVASLVQVWGFGIPTIPVDTHVNRISQRLGIVPKMSPPEKTQVVLESILKPSKRMVANRVLVDFGKDICRPSAPQCYRCPVYDHCVFERKAYFKARGRAKTKSYK